MDGFRRNQYFTLLSGSKSRTTVTERLTGISAVARRSSPTVVADPAGDVRGAFVSGASGTSAAQRTVSMASAISRMVDRLRR
jgi:hypothetical protein